MKLKLITTLAILALSSSVFAEKAEKCPNPVEIQKVGIMEQMGHGTRDTWLAMNRGQFYDTTNSWSFIMTDIVAENETEAYKIAVANLEGMKLMQGPVVVMGESACMYTTKDGYQAMTVTGNWNRRLR